MKYLSVTYSLDFIDAPEWRNPPAFVLRSILGLALRRLTCALKFQQTCYDCMVRDSCVYSVFFETNINKDVASLPGRDRATHPFVIDIDSLSEKEADVTITFIGRAVNYIPYVNLALKNAGDSFGIGRNRARFTVSSITIDGSEFSPNVKQIERQCKIWPSSDCLDMNPKVIRMVTPCRIKEQGKYTSTVTLDSLLVNMKRRVATLCELFGDESDKVDFELSPTDSTSISQKWIEKTYYSSRQKTKMQFGGVVGEIIINDEVPPATKAIIEAMELFHVGKNISFGLGKIKVEY